MHWCHLCILKTSTCFICRYNIQKFYYSQLWCNTFFCGKRPFEICVWDQLGGKNYVVHCTTLLYFSIYFLLRIETLRKFPITFTTVFISLILCLIPQCAMEENCLAPEAYRLRRENPNFSLETRRLLRFTASIANIGNADFRPFIPKSHWQWHACHMHYHSMEVCMYLSYAHYFAMLV